MDQNRRTLLLDIYGHALKAVDGRKVIGAWLRSHRLPAERVHLVAVGKAADAMASGARDALGERIVQALMVTKHGYGSASCARWADVIEAGHPVSDQASLAAGESLLRFLQTAPPEAFFLFLVSGGASALVESFPGGALEELQALHGWLLASGWDIGTMNRVRKAVSAIKGGRLACRLEGRRAVNLMISDVPGNDPAVIGSGLLVPDRDAASPLPEGLPGWVDALVEAAPAPPPVDSPCFAGVESVVVADNREACRAALTRAAGLGLAAVEHHTPLAGDAVARGRTLASELLDGPPGIHIWGGETTVKLPPVPGRGGRCQSLALAAATALAGHDDVLFLACGTDGTDGPTDDAGALVDGGTVGRGTEEGLDAERALAEADAGRFLEASGDLIQTGPTGTNVMDLVIAWKR